MKTTIIAGPAESEVESLYRDRVVARVALVIVVPIEKVGADQDDHVRIVEAVVIVVANDSLDLGVHVLVRIHVQKHAIITLNHLQFQM